MVGGYFLTLQEYRFHLCICQHNRMRRWDMLLKGCWSWEWDVLAVSANPLSPVILKFVAEPFVTIPKHHHWAFFECADVGFEVAEHVPSVTLLVRCICRGKLKHLLPRSFVVDILLCVAIRTIEWLPILEGNLGKRELGRRGNIQPRHPILSAHRKFASQRSQRYPTLLADEYYRFPWTSMLSWMRFSSPVPHPRSAASSLRPIRRAFPWNAQRDNWGIGDVWQYYFRDD